MESPVNSSIRFPEMRAEVIAALRSLADTRHQRQRWGVAEDGVNYYDDLTLNVHVLYDDCQVLPDPSIAIGSVIYDREANAFLALRDVLEPLLDDLGDRPDCDYISDVRWSGVVEAAEGVLEVMRLSD